jgi:uncharacterized membrane protein YphA (DoxX/SURF4 family)
MVENSKKANENRGEHAVNEKDRKKTLHGERSDKPYQAFRILQVAFIILPILAGLDKFVYLLNNWSQYIAPDVLRMIRGYDRVFMYIVGVVEIIAGIGIIFKPKVFSYIVAIWLLLIIVNLLITGEWYDIALRDFGLLLAAVALGRLSDKYDR